MIEAALVFVWLVVAALVIIGVIIWRSGAVDETKAGGALSALWNKLRGK